MFTAKLFSFYSLVLSNPPLRSWRANANVGAREGQEKSTPLSRYIIPSALLTRTTVQRDMCDIYVLYINNLLYKYLNIDYTYVKLENNIEFSKKKMKKR